jgi:hypothetical protein
MKGRHVLGYLFAITLLTGVFLSYGSSDLVIDLSNRLWGCG